ncbi:MAG: GFA family protein [Neomegalonema sp.]|nr:GFA family protein [Neomegalonema sp.]
MHRENGLVKTGGCMCGAVRYRAELTTREVLACHCEQCRRQSGNFWAAIHARGDLLEIDGGDAFVWRRFKQTERGFCRKCGSFILWRADGSPDVSIAAGSLDDASGLTLTAHIFLSEKPSYYKIEPGVECFSRDRGEGPIAPEA